MRIHTIVPLLAAAVLAACSGDSSPTSPSNPPPASAGPQFEITTLLTAYRNSNSDALWTRGTTTDARIGQILLGVDDLSTVGGLDEFEQRSGPRSPAGRHRSLER